VLYRLPDLEDAHLENIIRRLERAACLGVRVKVKYGYTTVYGVEAEQYLELSKYREEQERRAKIASLRKSVSELKAVLAERPIPNIQDIIRAQEEWFTQYHFYCNEPKRGAYR